MNIVSTPLPGVVVLEPQVHGDERGFFLETFRESHRAAAGISAPFIQDNHSRSTRGVLRGLHFQVDRCQGQLVRVSRGAVFDVVAEVRPESPHFGQWFGATLDDELHKQIYVPPGYAHGFCVLSDVADFEYRCTGYYDPDVEKGVAWNDADLAIDWPIDDPVLSERDAALPAIGACPREALPPWRAVS